MYCNCMINFYVFNLKYFVCEYIFVNLHLYDVVHSVKRLIFEITNDTFLIQNDVVDIKLRLLCIRVHIITANITKV